jgi:hypothetical protein
MIAADKEALQSQLKQRSLQIREKELNFFTENFTGIGTQSALLAGFAFDALTGVDTTESHWIPSVLFYFFATAAMCFNLICVCNCTFCSMCGPGLALRGPDGSMHEAVEGMQAERAETFRFFAFGIISIHFALCAAAWATATWYCATVTSVVLAFFLYKMYRYTLRIWNRFSLAEGTLVSGQLLIGGFFDAGAFSLQKQSQAIHANRARSNSRAAEAAELQAAQEAYALEQMQRQQHEEQLRQQQVAEHNNPANFRRRGPPQVHEQEPNPRVVVPPSNIGEARGGIPNLAGTELDPAMQKQKRGSMFGWGKDKNSSAMKKGGSMPGINRSAQDNLAHELAGAAQELRQERPLSRAEQKNILKL